MANIGKSLELFFIDGRPDGMLTAEVFNWTGHVLMTPPHTHRRCPVPLGSRAHRGISTDRGARRGAAGVCRRER